MSERQQPSESGGKTPRTGLDAGPERRAVVVAGMHRSGTSALAHAISLHGLDLPRSPMGAARGNELGHWGESKRIYELHEELLDEAGSSWDDVSPRPGAWLGSPVARKWRARMAEALAQEYPGSGPFVFKDPRISRLVPFWLSVLEELGVAASFVLPLRNPLEVSASLARRDGFGQAKGLLLWLGHNLDAERETRGHPRAFVAYEDLLRDWRSSMRAISAGIDLSWPRSGHRAEVEIERVLSGEQRHHAFSTDELSVRAEVVEWVKETHSLLLEACHSGDPPDPGRLDAIGAALADADLAYGPLVAAQRLDVLELGEAKVRLDAELSQVRGELDAQRDVADALAGERRELRDQITAHEAASAEQEAELAAVEARSRNRETEHRAELELARQSAVGRGLADLGDTLKATGLPQRGRALERARWARQLASWVIKPSGTTGLRSVREFLALRHSPLFDRVYYLRRNFDVANAGMNPLMHYIEHGARAGLDPSPSFSTARYLAEHPELARSGVNPLYHYLKRSGRAAGGRGPASKTRGSDKDPPGPAGPSPAAQLRLRPAHVAPRQTARAEVPDEARDAARASLAAKPLSVSVVLPTYNRVDGLRKALASALGQSYRALEVIVSDDGSTDGTEAAVRADFASELADGRLRYLRSERRRGSSAARNAGLEVAGGDLVAYLDSDNTWHADFLLLMAGELAARDDVSTAYCGFGVRDDAGAVRVRFDPHQRDALITRNYVDLNAFVHRRRLFDQLGGFDEDITRLVDWEMIIRYTRRYPALTVPYVLVDYYGGEAGDRVTHVEDFESNAAAVRRRVAHERTYSGDSPLRIGYVLWDYPALSQTFVLGEIRQLVEDGHDVRVYFHVAPDRAARLDFEVPAFQVADAKGLGRLLVEHGRTMLHSHFAYPAVTRLEWPAAIAVGIPFTFMVHAVDIFHQSNIDRNRIGEVASHELCVRVFAIGEFHRDFLIGRGVPAEKISIARPATSHESAPQAAVERRLARAGRVVACISRFVEKKGIEDLIRAASLLGDNVDVRIYGYGPAEDSLRRLVRELGTERVSFPGALEGPTQVAAALAEADVFALPCVVDRNGDMDGLPTVIGEAMAAGVPVVTTGLSAIPEVVQDGVTGFVVPPANPVMLSRKLAEVIGMDRGALRPLLRDAQKMARETWDVGKTVNALLDVWARPPLEIVLVTYSRDEEEGTVTTREILRRIYELTSTHFNLTIVDNGSTAAYTRSLEECVAGRENAALILLDDNVHWGPAMNIALDGARGETLIYVCSKEGFVLRPGWERTYVDFLRENRDVAMAGHLIGSPAFPTGRAYTEQRFFEGFRNKEFAERNPDREFSHVQGGLFCLRRSAYEHCGEFSAVAAQEAADIEYSYFLESLGWKLGTVPHVPSVTKKTRPRVSAHLDEHTVAAHPLTLESVATAASVAGGAVAFCNVCAWSGSSFRAFGEAADRCPTCRSTPFGRLVFRYLAGTTLPFRGLDCAAIIDDDPVREELDRMFALDHLGLSDLRGLEGGRDVVIADLAFLSDEELPAALEAIGSALGDGASAIVGGAKGRNESSGALEAFGRAGLAASEVSIPSRAVRFDPGGLVVAKRKASAARLTRR